MTVSKLGYNEIVTFITPATRSNRLQRRDKLLQQLGITQWQLRRPEALQGLVGSPLLPPLALIVLADPLPLLATPLLQDVLQSLQITEAQVGCYLLAPLAPLPAAQLYWSLGDSAVTSVQPMLLSPPLDQLLISAQAKRQLWQQIVQHGYCAPAAH